MSLIDKFISKIVPHDCINCGVEGGLLCNICIQKLPPANQRCYHCQSPSEGFATCEKCLAITPLQAVYSATPYQKVAKDLIWKFKSSGAQAAATLMATQMLPFITKLDLVNRTVIVSVPTATSRVRQRGFDQTRLMARQLALQSRLPWTECLKRVGQAHQVGSNRRQRLQQLNSALRVTQQRFVKGAHIILVDDVVTTGSTLEAAAKALEAAGAAKVEAITFAQA